MVQHRGRGAHFTCKYILKAPFYATLHTQNTDIIPWVRYQFLNTESVAFIITSPELLF